MFTLTRKTLSPPLTRTTRFRGITNGGAQRRGTPICCEKTAPAFALKSADWTLIVVGPVVVMSAAVSLHAEAREATTTRRAAANVHMGSLTFSGPSEPALDGRPADRRRRRHARRSIAPARSTRTSERRISRTAGWSTSRRLGLPIATMVTPGVSPKSATRTRTVSRSRKCSDPWYGNLSGDRVP